MTPKMCPDEDGDIPPCSVMYSIASINDWEHIKQVRYEFKVRKAPCACRYYEGIMPSTHQCYAPHKYSLFKRICAWLRSPKLKYKYI